MWKTHLIGGLQAGLLATAALHPETQVNEILMFEVAVMGSLIPDIDHEESKISRSDVVLNIISNTLTKFAKHRRATHTVWAAALFALLIGLVLLPGLTSAAMTNACMIALIIVFLLDIFGFKAGIFVGLLAFLCLSVSENMGGEAITTASIVRIMVAGFLGYISHLIYDSANKEGIMWLHPYSKKRYRYLTITTSSNSETLFAVINFFILWIIVIITFF